MSNHSKQHMSPVLKWTYIVLLVVLAFSGFGQMPIYQRYYITSIPGLGWSGNFLSTISVHLVASVLLMVLLTYQILVWAAQKALWPPKTGAAWLRTVLLLAVIGSGFILTVRNLPGVVLNPAMGVTASLVHAFGAMLFLIMAATYFRMKRAKAK